MNTQILRLSPSGARGHHLVRRGGLVCHDGSVGLPDVLMSLCDLVQMNVSPASLASLFEEEFKQDMAALKVSCGVLFVKAQW